VRVLPISRPVARRYVLIRGSLRRQGRLIAQPDLLIAATAIHHDLTLVTRNLRHYERIPGLKLLIPDA
jgi:predicted nucleic acid-binding protein